MVIISRRKNESLVIGDNITVTVIEIRGDKVRLGVELPKEMSLHRREVYDAIHRAANEVVSSPRKTLSVLQFTHAVVFVSDMARSVAFYRDVLGLPVRSESPEWTEFEMPGNTLALHLADGPGPANFPQGAAPAGQCQLGFTVEDIDAFHQEMTAKGVVCLQPPEEEDFGTLAEYADPDGLPFSVMEEKSVAEQPGSEIG
jgi:carbon storage regulator CsrA